MLDEALLCTGTRASHIFPFLLDIIYFIKIKYTKWWYTCTDVYK